MEDTLPAVEPTAGPAQAAAGDGFAPAAPEDEAETKTAAQLKKEAKKQDKLAKFEAKKTKVQQPKTKDGETEVR